MARSRQLLSGFATVEEALQTRNLDQLKRLAAVIPEAGRAPRKDDLIILMSRYLRDVGHLRALWLLLDSTQQNAVREVLYSAEGSFNPDRFQARYDASPEFDIKEEGRHRGDPTPLRLFIHSSYGQERYSGGFIPLDLQEPLRTFVPQPEPDQLKAMDELPESFKKVEKEYEYSTDPADFGPTVYMQNRVFQVHRPARVKEIVREFPLQRRDTERAALQEVVTLLRLVDGGKVAVSDRTAQPSAATMLEIGALLRDGDFYEAEPQDSRRQQEIGPIRAFAWPLLLQAARLVELNRKKLALTKAGRHALGAAAADTLSLLWRQWTCATLLDEFSRVETIKGQHGKGKRGLTDAKARRVTISEALKQCPIGRWVEFDEFSRFMRAAALYFDVSLNPWTLYISDPHYGHFGYEGYGGWNMLQERYMLCLLFEYAATLGMIDVAYVTPQYTRGDFRAQWGTDDLAFLSRYDGLRYFRLNPLGAYCLGLTSQYTPSQPEARVRLTVLPNLEIQVGGGLAPEEKLLLETYAENEFADTWRLSREKILSMVENGSSLAELRGFLQARDDQELPGPVSAFFNLAERNARALRTKGQALLIECADAELAELLATHERSRKLCVRAGERQLAVRVADEPAFRKAAHLLGYGMPPA